MARMNLFDAIRTRSVAWSEHNAVRSSTAVTTFAELLQQADRLADALQRAGLKTGAGFGVVDRNSVEFIIGMLAGLKCGAVVLPIANNLTAPEQEQIIEETGVHLVIREAEDGAITIGQRRYGVQRFDRAQQHIAPHVPDAAFIRFTSGTTGTSKGVIIGHRSAIERVEAANQGLQLGPDDAVVWVLPMAYHFVVSVMLYLYFGTTIVLSEDFTAAEILRAAATSGATLLYASPMHVRMLVSDQACTSLGSLKRVISTSAGTSVELCRRFNDKFGQPVCQAFGIIEVGLPIINLRNAADHPEAVGHALRDYDVAVLNDDLEMLADGATGQLAVRGPGMFDGYLQPPALRSSVLRNGWFLTGDLATRSPDGLLTIAGRSKSVINVAGNKVFPEEVEAALCTHPAVDACHVIGGKHPLFGEVVEADVVLFAGTSADAEELIAHCRKRLAAYKLPQRIRFVRALELTATGKVKRS
ncbi:MAG: AMP-binding protein [Flavobacteriales bacterium]